MSQTNERRFPFTSFPDGIFAVAFSHEIQKKQVKPIKFMGEEIALFRSEDGTIGALDSYCPHLGANLSYGIVKNNALQCPFHGIQFKKDGASLTKNCHGLANFKTKNWDSLEQYNLVFLIHNPKQNNLPIQFPEWNLSDWAKPIENCFTIKSHPQEILENSVDRLHFFKVHNYLSIKTIEPFKMIGSEFTIQYQVTRKGGLFDFLEKESQIEFFIKIHAYGLGFSKVEIWLPKYNLNVTQIVFPTPIDGEVIHLRTLTSVKIPEKFPLIPNWMMPFQLRKTISNYLSRIMTKGFLKDFLPDLSIWENKKYVAQPKYLPKEEDIEKYRKWASQFYRQVDQPASICEIK